MTPLVIIQIIYLAINIIGTVIGFMGLWADFEFPFVDKLLTGSSKRWVQVIVSIFEILLIALFIPAITVLTIVYIFFVIIGTNFEK